MLVTASQEAGVIEEDEEQMLHRVFGFGDLTAGQVMLPRTEMIALPVQAGRDDLLERLSQQPRSRASRLRAHLDDIAGVVRMRDMVRAISARPEVVDLTPLLREALTVPETLRPRRSAHRDAQASDVAGHRHRRVRRHRRHRHVRAADGAHRRRDRCGSDAAPTRVSVLTDGSALIDGLTLTTDVNAQFGLHDRRGRLQHDWRLRARAAREKAAPGRCGGGGRPADPGRGPRWHSRGEGAADTGETRLSQAGVSGNGWRRACLQPPANLVVAPPRMESRE